MKKIVLCLVAAVLGMASLSAQDKWYGVKSGILKSFMDDGTTTADITVWFDDYGDKVTTIQITHMEGLGDIKYIMVYKGDKMYTVNEGRKEVSETARPEANYLTLTDQMVKDFKIKEEGKETIMGKDCTIYSHQTKQLMRTVTIKEWKWDGFTMKSSMQRGRREVLTEPVDWQENVEIPASVFDPESYIQ